MRIRHLILLLFTLLMLSACGRGPDDDVLSVDIQQRLDQQFADKLFKINNLTRKGSAPRLDKEGIYIYYNLELEFLRNYNLTAWRGLNLGTLASVLGATTTGISGFNSKGNAKGELLTVRGRIAYSDIDGNWSANTFTPIQTTKPHAIKQTLDAQSPKSMLKSIKDLLDNNVDDARSEQDKIIVSELQRTVARIGLGRAELNGDITLGTGWPAGSYYQFGEAFAEYARTQDYTLFNYASEGSLENGYRVNTGRIDFAILQSDVAEVLYKGWVEEEQLPQSDLRAVASLWPEAVHIISLDESGLERLSDLKDKRIAIGSLRSGTRFTAARIWLAADLGRLNYKDVQTLSRGDAIKALENKQVDAVIIVGAVPDPAIQDLAQRRDDLHFIAVPQTVISQLVDQNFAYYGSVIPDKTYPSQTQTVATLGMTALLTTNKHTPDKVVIDYMTLMSEGVDEIAKTFYLAGFISAKTVRLGISMPLHPAVEKYYSQPKEAVK